MAIENRNQMVLNGSVLVERTTLLGTTGGNAINWRRAGGTTLLSTAASTDNGAVTVQYDIDDKIGFLISWYATAAVQAATLTVASGTAGRAWQRDIGNIDIQLNTTAGAQTARHFVGPFESARIAIRSESTIQAPVGRNYVQFTLSTDSTTLASRRCNIVAFRMPTVIYSS